MNRLSCISYINNINQENDNNNLNVLSEIAQKNNNLNNILTEFKNFLSKDKTKPYINKKSHKNLFRPKSLSIMVFNNDDNLKDNLNINRKIKHSTSNLFLTSSTITNYKTNPKLKVKKSLAKNKTYNNFFKKNKTLEEVIKEAEKKFENNYKTPKSYLLSLKNFENNFLINKKSYEKNKIFFDYIKSDLEQKTKSLNKREKINMSKIKKYKNNLKYLLEQIEFGKKIEKDINKFKKRYYISSKNLNIFKNYEKDKIKNNDINLSGSVNIKDFFKNKKIDLFGVVEFSKKINRLNENVAYKYPDLIKEKIRLNFDDIYNYKRNSKIKKKEKKAKININLNN